jgi:hypothetical protein
MNLYGQPEQMHSSGDLHWGILIISKKNLSDPNNILMRDGMTL